MTKIFILHGGGLLPATLITQTPKRITCEFYICDVKSVRTIHKNCMARSNEKILLQRNKENFNQLSILRVDSGLYPHEINVDENVGVV